jgi:hypothetical protein
LAVLSLALAAASASASFVAQAPLIASDQIGTSFIGSAVALSSDGKTALVGGPGDNGNVGAAWVFKRSGSTWTQQAKLTGGGEGGHGEFGESVALSGDGKTVLIGGPYDNEGVGAAWVFKRSGSTWNQQGGKLSANDEICGGQFGSSVALSGDGKTVLIGGPNDSCHYFASGAAWVFTRSKSMWMQQGPKLLITSQSENTLSGNLGQRVSLSGDGNTALVQGQDSESSHGNAGAFVFTRSGSTWTQGPNACGNFFPPCPLRGGWESDSALSSDGNTALIEYRTPCYCFGPGGALVFARSGSTWTQQGPELTSGEDVFESDAALSGDGNTALITDSTHPGVLVFTRSGSTWTQQSPPLACGGEGCGSRRCAACAPAEDVTLSGDARTAVVGTTVFVNRPPHN